MSEVSVFDVAAYVLKQRGPMTTMKLQKLVYYSQAWHLAWTGRPLFRQIIEAWDNGPVCPALFKAHRGRYSVSTLPGGDLNALSREQQSVVDRVLAAYGALEASQLSELTHSERPWIDAQARRRQASEIIRQDEMREYYRRLGKRGHRVEEIDWSAWQ